MKKSLLLFAAMALGCVALQAQDAAGNAENGKKLWVKDNCYSCHGFDGHGGAGVKLAPKPIAVNGIHRHRAASAEKQYADLQCEGHSRFRPARHVGLFEFDSRNTGGEGHPAAIGIQ